LFRFSSLFFAVLSSTKPAPLSLHDALPISAFLPCSPRCVLSFPAARVVAPLAASFAELVLELARVIAEELDLRREACALAFEVVDRKSTRLNSSHVKISYAVFCLKKKKINY